MVFHFQDVEYFRSGLKLLFVAPVLGLCYYPNHIRQDLCGVHTLALAVSGLDKRLCDVTGRDLEPTARLQKQCRCTRLLTSRQRHVSIML
jgi:hypothetical protein